MFKQKQFDEFPLKIVFWLFVCFPNNQLRETDLQSPSSFHHLHQSWTHQIFNGSEKKQRVGWCQPRSNWISKSQVRFTQGNHLEKTSFPQKNDDQHHSIVSNSNKGVFSTKVPFVATKYSATWWYGATPPLVKLFVSLLFLASTSQVRLENSQKKIQKPTWHVQHMQGAKKNS